MTHPDDRRLALYSSGDAAWMENFVVGRHVRECDACRSRVDAYRRDQAVIRREASELPPGVDWKRLSEEMTANIHLGLEAGACVPDTKPVRVKPIAWRPVFAAAGLAAVVLTGLYLNFPPAQKASLARGIERIWANPRVAEDLGVALTATRTGIEVRENGSSLTMVNPGKGPSAVMVSTSGSLRARYVDDDTGQVTITNVYAQ